MSDKPIEQVQSENAELIDRILHDVLKNGEEKVLQDGTVIRTKPSAAMLKTAIERAKFLKTQSPLGHGRPADDLVAEAERRLRFTGGSMPPLSDQDDAATA